jgi:multiple antibiotic resistance protein
MNFELFLAIFVKFVFLLTPFFAINMFISLTQGCDRDRQRAIAIKVTLVTLGLCTLLFFLGKPMLVMFGLDLNGFRMGAGVLLMLTAIALAQGPVEAPKSMDAEDVAVVPLAIPTILGPATISTILVYGTEQDTAGKKCTAFAALISALLCVGVLLWFANFIERLVGPRVLRILSKLTGIILAAIAAQMIMAGYKNLMNGP